MGKDATKAVHRDSPLQSNVTKLLQRFNNMILPPGTTLDQARLNFVRNSYHLYQDTTLAACRADTTFSQTFQLAEALDNADNTPTAVMGSI